MATAKCYVNDERVKEVKLEFAKIQRTIKGISTDRFDFREEFYKIKTLCELVEYMNTLNDYQASCLAYMYTLPRIVDLVKFVSLYISGKVKPRYIKSNPALDKWVMNYDEKTEVRLNDGSIKKHTRMEYLYSYLKDRQMAMAARYFIHWNIHYLEKEKNNKAYPTREKVLESAVWWTNQLVLGRFGLMMPDSGDVYNFTPKKIIFSTMPSSGKSFLCNTANEMFSVLSYIINKRGGVLRVSNEQSNILRQSSQTMALIKNGLIFDIYPEMGMYINSSSGKYDPFGKSSEEEWGIKGCEYTPNTSIFKTRDSAINSVRCELGMFDDPSRGLQESNNVQIHQKICTIFNGDFLDRFENQSEIAVLLTGTMFNPFDVFSTEIQKVTAKGILKDKRFKNTFISKDKKTVIIVNDCENDDGSSAYPEFISDEDLKNKRESLPAYDYHCIWRQKPIPSDALIFAKELLRFYDSLPREELSSYAFASIDPTRKRANDYFAMPIFREHLKTGDFYLVDIIYEKKGSLDLMDKIINKIINNNVLHLCLEENINDTLYMIIKQKLEYKGITNCDIKTIYATANKQRRIADMAETIKRRIIFPSALCAPVKSEMGNAIYMLTQYSDDTSNRHDDFPDALSQFCNTYIVNQKRNNYIKLGNKLPF